MTTIIFRTFSNLAGAMFVAGPIIRSRTWFAGIPIAQFHLEAVLLGVLSGLLIAALVSLIKLILTPFLLSTRNEVLVAYSPNLIIEDDEHHPGDFYSQDQRFEDRQRDYLLEDTFEIEMHEEMV